ncbi:MAG: permease of the major facilitator superfamily [Chlorobi bacterium]|nr:permease of the major facilitator superfamily [Chlorobiota bacterium]
MKEDQPIQAHEALTGEESPVAATSSDESRLKGIVRALRYPNYRLFFGGQLISLIGTWMQSVAESWLIYRLTGSSVLLGMVGFAGQIPVFLLAPIGGIVADRFNRRSIIIVTQICSMILALAYAAITLLGVVQVWHIFVLAALLGIVNAFDIPARQSFVVEMVGKEDLINAIALNSSMFNGARIVGPAVAGILVAMVGEGWCFLINGTSYIAVIAGLLMMKFIPRERARTTATPLDNIIEGFRFVWQTRPIRALMILLGATSLVAMPYAVLMPVYVDKILKGGASDLGLLMGASGVGALLGALMLAARRGVKGLGNWLVYGTAVFGISIILFAMSREFWAAALSLVPAGFAMMVAMASSNTLVQVMVPDNLRGRVMAVYSMMFMGMAPLGALLAGVLANHLGAPATIAIGGTAAVVGALIFKIYLPGLRGEARQLIVAQGMVGGNPPEKIGGQEVTAQV